MNVYVNQKNQDAIFILRLHDNTKLENSELDYFYVKS